MKATWGAWTGARGCALALVAVLAACGDSPREARTTPRTVPIASFIAEVDPAAGTIVVTPLGDDPLPSALTYWTGLQQVPVVRNAVWGSPAAGTVEVRNATGFTPGIVTDGCGPGDDSYEGMVEIHSGSALRNVYVELFSISATNHGSCKSFPMPGLAAGIDETRGGIFPYGDIAAGGSANARWSFKLPLRSTAPFTFQGRIMAEVLDTTPPTTTAEVVNGTYAVTLTCADAGSGCAGTFFTIDGGAEQPYTHPVRISGTQHLCSWSEDLAGNFGSATCADLTVSGSVGAATHDPGLGAPVCPQYVSTCDTSADHTVESSIIRYAGVPAETTAPNNVSGCTDVGLGGSPDVLDEAVHRLVLETVGGGPFLSGRTVRLTADVFAPYFDDYFYAYYATQLNGASTAWTPVPGPAGAGVQLAGTGPQTLTYEFTLPPGAVAIRGHIVYTARSATWACHPDGLDVYYDNDDLVFSQNVDPTGSSTPTVSVTAPASGATVSRRIVVTANATDDVGVSQVQFQYNTGAGWMDLGSADTSPPWAAEWDTAAVYGAVELRAVATDTAGGSTGSAAVAVTVVDATPPAVTLTTPASGASYSRTGNLTLAATATDARTIGSVDWYVDGVLVGHSETVLANDLLNATWNPMGNPTFAAGTHSAWARATDIVGNVAQTPIIQFTLE